MAASLCSGLTGRKIEALAWNRASWIPILCPAPSACYYFCLCCCSCCCCCTKNNIENVSETRRQLPALFSPAFFFFTTFPFCPFWQWVLIAFGRDPFRVHWPRFRLLSIWQGARCAVWRRVDATTSRQLLVTSFGTWLPVQPGVRTSH